MADKSALDELDRDIAILRDNIRQLTEQAAALSGAGDEDRASSRIAQQDTQLTLLLKRRDALAKVAAPAGKVAPPAAKKAAPSVAKKAAPAQAAGASKTPVAPAKKK